MNGAISALNDWITAIIAGLGLTLTGHEFLGGMLLAIAGSMIARNWFAKDARKEVWLTLAAAAFTSVIGLPLVLEFVPGLTLAQPVIMGALGFLSRFILGVILSGLSTAETNVGEVIAGLINRYLNKGTRK